MASTLIFAILSGLVFFLGLRTTGFAIVELLGLCCRPRALVRAGLGLGDADQNGGSPEAPPGAGVAHGSLSKPPPPEAPPEAPQVAAPPAVPQVAAVSTTTRGRRRHLAAPRASPRSDRHPLDPDRLARERGAGSTDQGVPRWRSPSSASPRRRPTRSRWRRSRSTPSTTRTPRCCASSSPTAARSAPVG